MSERVEAYTITKKADLKWNSRARCSKKKFLSVFLWWNVKAPLQVRHWSLCAKLKGSQKPRRLYTHKKFSKSKEQALTILKSYLSPSDARDLYISPRKVSRPRRRFLCIGLKRFGEKNHRRWDEGGGKKSPVFVAVNVVSVWRPGFPVLGLFVVYIARAPSNYCADATPTRGVWSQIHSLCHNLSRLYGRPDRSPCNVDRDETHMGLRFTPLSVLIRGFRVSRRLLSQSCTYRHVTSSLDRPRAPNSGDGHFQSVARVRQSVRVVLPLCPDNTRLRRAFAEPSPGEKRVHTP